MDISHTYSDCVRQNNELKEQEIGRLNIKVKLLTAFYLLAKYHSSVADIEYVCHINEHLLTWLQASTGL